MKSPRAPLDPWQKIIRAGKRNTGLRLTANEVWRLSRDEAIQQAASQQRAEEMRHGKL